MGISTSMFRAKCLLPFSIEKPLEFLFFFSSMSHVELNSFWLSTSNSFHETKLGLRGHNLGRFLSNSCTSLGCVWGETTTRPHIDNTKMRSMLAATHTQTQHTHMRSERLNEDMRLHGHVASRGRCSPPLMWCNHHGNSSRSRCSQLLVFVLTLSFAENLIFNISALCGKTLCLGIVIEEYPIFWDNWECSTNMTWDMSSSAWNHF